MGPGSAGLLQLGPNLALEPWIRVATLAPMKFIWASLVILLISTAMGAGILLGAHGHGWLWMGLSTLAFLGLFAGYGCRT